VEENGREEGVGGWRSNRYGDEKRRTLGAAGFYLGYIIYVRKRRIYIGVKYQLPI
jgi:hypothetical protein